MYPVVSGYDLFHRRNVNVGNQPTTETTESTKNVSWYRHRKEGGMEGPARGTSAALTGLSVSAAESCCCGCCCRVSATKVSCWLVWRQFLRRFSAAKTGTLLRGEMTSMYTAVCCVVCPFFFVNRKLLVRSTCVLGRPGCSVGRSIPYCCLGRVLPLRQSSSLAQGRCQRR